MKKLFLMLALTATALAQSLSAQTSAVEAKAGLLPLYYEVKDALVKGNAGLAATKAQNFIKTIPAADDKLSAGNRELLIRYAGSISNSMDIKLQREAFGSFSNSMILLLNGSTAGSALVYKQYCPMKKMYWLSSEKAIKNPYYGSSMLTCGNVVETL